MGRLELRLIASYLLWWLLFEITFLVVDVLLSVFFGMTLTSSSTGLVIASATAMMPGQLYYKRFHAIPPRPYSWRMAAWFAAINTLIGYIYLAVALPSLWANIISSAWMFGFMGFLACIQLLATRFFFRWGATLAEKRSERRAVEV